MSAEPEAAGVGLSRSLARAFALHFTLRALEALALGWLACACVLAAVSISTPYAEPVQAGIAASIAFVCCGASWWIERAPERASHLRALDRRLGFDGALITAEELETTSAGGRLATLLVSHVAGRVRGPDLARASLPRTPLLVVAALLGTAVLFAAKDSDPAADRPLDEANSAVSRALTAAAGALRSAAARTSEPGVPSEARQVRVDLASALESTARNPLKLEAEGPALEERLLEAARAARTGTEEALALTEARTALERSRRGLRPTPEAAPGPHAANPPAEGNGSGGASGSEANQRPSGAGVAGAGASPDPASASGALASTGSDGRMVAQNPPPDVGNMSPAPSAASRGPERGVANMRWWPARYDRIVQVWLEPTHPPKHE